MEKNREGKTVMPTNAENVYDSPYTERFADSKLPENQTKTRDHTVLPSTIIYL